LIRTGLGGAYHDAESNKNAVIISRKLNLHLYNNYPTKEEVEKLNAVPPYTP